LLRSRRLQAPNAEHQAVRSVATLDRAVYCLRDVMELTARIHIEEGSCWADVPELPGCFASGDTLGELFESLQEGVALYLADSAS